MNCQWMFVEDIRCKILKDNLQLRQIINGI